MCLYCLKQSVSASRIIGDRAETPFASPQALGFHPARVHCAYFGTFEMTESGSISPRSSGQAARATPAMLAGHSVFEKFEIGEQERTQNLVVRDQLSWCRGRKISPWAKRPTEHRGRRRLLRSCRRLGRPTRPRVGDPHSLCRRDVREGGERRATRSGMASEGDAAKATGASLLHRDTEGRR